ncbi:MAG: SHD1 domain-containing protein [Pirellulales bacterium]
MLALFDKFEFAFLAAQPNEEMPWWFPWGAAGVGIILIFTGVYQIKTRRAKAARGLTRLVMRWFGYTEMTGKLAAFNGYMNAGGGVVLILAAPFLSQFAGILKEKPVAPVAAADPPRANVSGQPPENITDRDADHSSAPTAAEPGIPAPPPAVLGDATQPLPSVEYSDADVKPTLRVGQDQPPTYDDRAPQQGVLVGTRLYFDRPSAGHLVGLQPIYQVSTKYQLGRVLGSNVGSAQDILAKPGFAVGRMEIFKLVSLEAVRLTFCKVEGNELSPTETYQSDWFGNQRGQPLNLSSGRALAVGLLGSAEHRIHSLGIYRTSVPDHFAQTLGKPAVSLPEQAAPASPTPVEIKASNQETFRDIANDGAVLVGLRVTQGEEWGGAVRAIQPIYQKEDAYRVGAWCGEPGESPHVLMAKPGYVVSRIDARAGAVVNSIQLQFSLVRDGRLDPQDSYSSEWIGSPGGGPRIAISPPALIVGLAGRSARSLQALTYYTVPPPAPATSRDVAAKDANVEKAPQAVSRKWTSADGRFSIDAVLIGVEEEQAVLRTADGREIKVRLDRLGKDDQDFAAQWRAAQRGGG